MSTPRRGARGKIFLVLSPVTGIASESLSNLSTSFLRHTEVTWKNDRTGNLKVMAEHPAGE